MVGVLLGGYGNLAVVPLQFVEYYVMLTNGYDVDKPRNFLMSLTVE